MNPPSGSRYLKDCRLTTLLQDSLLDERDHSAIEATHRRLQMMNRDVIPEWVFHYSHVQTEQLLTYDIATLAVSL